MSTKYHRIFLNKNSINKLFSGLIYPDSPCGLFYMNKQSIVPELKICNLLKFELSSSSKEVSSQVNESHNEFFAFNHSMSSSNKYTTAKVTYLLLQRIIALCKYFVDNYETETSKGIAFLGYMIHIVHDSWSGGHTIRQVTQYEEKNVSSVTQLKKILTKDKIKDVTNYDLAFKGF